MKRLSLLGLFSVVSALLAGCPVWGSGDTGCQDGNCGGGWSSSSGGGSPGGCDSPDDCGTNQTCGSDGFCHPGDCTIWGCVTGFTCEVDPKSNTASCVPSGSSSSSSSGSSTSSSSSSSGSSGSVYCGKPADCAASETCDAAGTCQAGDCTAVGSCVFGFHCDASNNTCVRDNPNGCGTDVECVNFGAGYACVSGICTQPLDQCWDGGQCPANDKCAAGKCTPGCVNDNDCPASYTCDTALGICATPVQPCTITNDCGGPDLVCVAGACVPRSVNGQCPAGSSWVDNGCIPDQKATFLCQTDGVQDACAGGSICLHHACYISCAAPMSNVCDTLPSLNLCKPVTTVSGQHDVCASTSNLGSECDLSANIPCAANKICIDGYCK